MKRENVNKTVRILFLLLLIFTSIFGSGEKVEKGAKISSRSSEISRIVDYIGKQRPGLRRSEKQELAEAIYKSSSLLVFPKRSEFADDRNIDRVAFLIGVIQAESQFKRTAKSPKGALGYMQIMPATATWLAKKKSITYRHKQDLFLAETNLKMGVLHLNDLMRQTGSPKNALLAYNAGLGGFRKWGGLKAYPKNIAAHYHSWKDFQATAPVYQELAFLK